MELNKKQSPKVILVQNFDRSAICSPPTVLNSATFGKIKQEID